MIESILLATTLINNDFQEVNPNRKLFQFNIQTDFHGDESRYLKIDGPFGDVYSSNWTHEELIRVDFRRIKVDWLWIKEVPLFFGMSFKTWTFPVYAAAFQTVSTDIGLNLPLYWGLSVGYEVRAASFSGHQVPSAIKFIQWRTQEILPEISFLFFEWSQYGQAWNQSQLYFNHGDPNDLWYAQKWWKIRTLIDLRVIGLPAYGEYNYTEHYNDDPTQPNHLNKKFIRHSWAIGQQISLGNDLSLKFISAIEVLENLIVPRVSGVLTIGTNFN